MLGRPASGNKGELEFEFEDNSVRSCISFYSFLSCCSRFPLQDCLRVFYSINRGYQGYIRNCTTVYVKMTLLFLKIVCNFGSAFRVR